MRDLDGKLLSTAEVAALLGCSTRNVFELVNAGRLVPLRLSGSPRGKLKFEPAEIAKLVERSREPRKVTA